MSSSSPSSRFETSLFEAARIEVRGEDNRELDKQLLQVQDKLFLTLVVELGLCFSFLHHFEIFTAACVCKPWAGAARAFFANARQVSISVPGGGGSAATEATIRLLLGKLALCETLDLSRCINLVGNTLRFVAPACGTSLRDVDVSWCGGVSASSISQRLVAERGRLLPHLSTVTARGIFVEQRLAEVAISSSSTARTTVLQQVVGKAKPGRGGQGAGLASTSTSSLQLCIGSCEQFEAGGEVWRRCLCARDTTVIERLRKQGALDEEETQQKEGTNANTEMRHFLFTPQCGCERLTTLMPTPHCVQMDRLQTLSLVDGQDGSFRFGDHVSPSDPELWDALALLPALSDLEVQTADDTRLEHSTATRGKRRCLNYGGTNGFRGDPVADFCESARCRENLRRLCLSGCTGISDKGVDAAFRNIPFLRELSLSRISAARLTASGFRNAGVGCRGLAGVCGVILPGDDSWVAIFLCGELSVRSVVNALGNSFYRAGRKSLSTFMLHEVGEADAIVPGHDGFFSKVVPWAVYSVAAKGIVVSSRSPDGPRWVEVSAADMASASSRRAFLSRPDVVARVARRHLHRFSLCACPGAAPRGLHTVLQRFRPHLSTLSVTEMELDYDQFCVGATTERLLGGVKEFDLGRCRLPAAILTSFPAAGLGSSLHSLALGSFEPRLPDTALLALCRSYSKGSIAFPRLSLLDLHGFSVSATAAEALLRSCPKLECIRADFGPGLVRGLAAVLTAEVGMLSTLSKVQLRAAENGSADKKRDSAALELLEKLEDSHPRIDWERWPDAGSTLASSFASPPALPPPSAAAVSITMEDALRGLKKRMKK